MAKKFQDGLYWRSNGLSKDLVYVKKTGWGYHTIISMYSTITSMESNLLENERLEPISINNRKDLISLITAIKELRT
jgi:hypothetical protein